MNYWWILLVVVVVVFMFSGGKVEKKGGKSVIHSFPTKLKSSARSVTSGNKMVIGILVGLALCWAYGKFGMEGFDTRDECENECPEAATLCKDHFCRMNPRAGEAKLCELPDINNTTPCQTVGSATTGVIGEDTAQQLMDQGGVDSLLAGLSNASAIQRDRDNRTGDGQTFINRLCGLDRAGLTSQEQQMVNTWCRTGQGEN